MSSSSIADFDPTPHLKAYCETGSQAAFQLLVKQYSPMVYATVRHRTGCHEAAQEVLQQIFTDLAARAPALAWDRRLGAWLHRRALFAASSWLRAEWRRRNREAEAMRRMDEPSAPQEENVESTIAEALQALSTVNAPC